MPTIFDQLISSGIVHSAVRIVILAAIIYACLLCVVGVFVLLYHIAMYFLIGRR